MAITYIKTLRTGGGVNALDGIEGNALTAGAYAKVYTAGDILYNYKLTEAGAAESDPLIIVPDSNPGNFNWELMGINAGPLAYTKEVRALTSDGLKLTDDAGGYGVFIKDGGNVGVNTGSPVSDFHVLSNASDNSVVRFDASTGDSKVLVWETAANRIQFQMRDESNNLAIYFNPGGNCYLTSETRLGIGSTNGPSVNTAAIMYFGPNGGDPTPGTDTACIYGYGTSPTNIRACDEAGSATTLTPHAFPLFTPDPTERYPWSYHSVNTILGVRINVDMAGVVRAVEALSGKQFIYYEDIPKRDMLKERKEAWIKDFQENEENAVLIEVSKTEALKTINIPAEPAKPQFALLKDGTVKQTTTAPVKAKTEKRLKNGYTFDNETGKFYRLDKPAYEDVATKYTEKELPQWIKERLAT